LPQHGTLVAPALGSILHHFEPTQEFAMPTVSRLVAGATIAGLLAACAGDGSGPSARTQVTFHLATGSSSPAPALAFLSDTLASNGDTLVLDTVQLVLRDIKFKRVGEDLCDGEHDDGEHNDSTHEDVATTTTTAFSHDEGDDDGNNGESDACESFNAGPFLLDVPLGNGVSKVFSVAVDTGTFGELRIKIHKPEDNGDQKDIDFLTAHPGFKDISIRAVGSFKGTAFVFTSDLNAQEKMELVPPLVVSTAVTNVDVTIKVDVAAWFASQAGGLVDPASANKGGANEELVRDNIKDSFHAFRDDDQDGQDDDQEHHGT
jgi:hypothetical protein